jgi:hypothetical protein
VTDIERFQTQQALVDKYAIKRMNRHTFNLREHEFVVATTLTKENLREVINKSTPAMQTALNLGLLRAKQAPKVVFCRQIYGLAYMEPVFEDNSSVRKLYSMLVPTSCVDISFSRGVGAPEEPARSLYAVDRDAPGGYVDLLSFMQPSIFDVRGAYTAVAADGVHAADAGH